MKPRKQITLEPASPEMTKEQQIALLEKQLLDPNCSPKDAAPLSRQIAILKGLIQVGVYQHSTTSFDQRQERKHAEEEHAERLRREAAGELPIWWSGRQCRIHLFWALCDTVSEPDFDGIINANPQPKNAISAAINQLWVSLPDSVKSKLQALAAKHQQRSPLSGHDEVQMLERACILIGNLTPGFAA
jgi:hypothetical protein